MSGGHARRAWLCEQLTRLTKCARTPSGTVHIGRTAWDSVRLPGLKSQARFVVPRARATPLDLPAPRQRGEKQAFVCLRIALLNPSVSTLGEFSRSEFWVLLKS